MAVPLLIAVAVKGMTIGLNIMDYHCRELHTSVMWEMKVGLAWGLQVLYLSPQVPQVGLAVKEMRILLAYIQVLIPFSWPEPSVVVRREVPMKLDLLSRFEPFFCESDGVAVLLGTDAALFSVFLLDML